jgi:hypothetical protein
MNIALIALALQILLVVCSLLRGRSEDARFAGDKLGFRS